MTVSSARCEGASRSKILSDMNANMPSLHRTAVSPGGALEASLANSASLISEMSRCVSPRLTDSLVFTARILDEICDCAGRLAFRPHYVERKPTDQRSIKIFNRRHDAFVTVADFPQP